MRLPRTCKVCGNEFIAIKTTQFYCRRKCFKRAFYVKTKDKIKETKVDYPIKKCGFCEEISRLNFDPVKSPERFNAWGCPHCGATNMLLWEYQYNPSSRQIIGSILMTFQTYNSIQAPRYEPYHLPVPKLEQGNPSVVVMTCETLNITDIQKRDRKKLLFS